MHDEMKEVLETFSAECAEHIQRATDCILLIEEQKDEEAINELFRAFHTIKGNALMLGFDRIGALAHSSENVLSRMRNGSLEPTKQGIDILLGSLDCITAMLASGEDEEESEMARLISGLDAIAEAKKSPQNVRIEMAATRQQSIPVSPPRTPERAPAPITEPLRNPEPGSPSGRFLNILVVDDDYLTRRTLTAMLKPYGSCDVASDGKDAILAFTSALDDRPYDLVCMDIMMPGMDGFETVRQIRSAEMIAAARSLRETGASHGSFQRSDVVIIMTSTLDDPESYINACYRCGANAYLVKPINPESLSSTLEHFSLT